MATTADHSHGSAATTHGTAHGTAHGGVPAEAHHAAHGHIDTSGDKAAAFMGLFAGMVLLGGLLYGMVTWTNSRYAHEGGAKPAAEASH